MTTTRRPSTAKKAPPVPAASLGGSAAGTVVHETAHQHDARPVHEPVWLVRIVIVLFLIGFAAFLAREVQRFLEALNP